MQCLAYRLQQDNTSFASLVTLMFRIPLPKYWKGIERGNLLVVGERGNLWLQTKTKALSQTQRIDVVLLLNHCAVVPMETKKQIFGAVSHLPPKFQGRMFWKVFLSMTALLFCEWVLCAASLHSCAGDKAKPHTQPPEHFLSSQFFRRN